jgi:hypothetical protein
MAALASSTRMFPSDHPNSSSASRNTRLWKERRWRRRWDRWESACEALSLRAFIPRVIERTRAALNDRQPAYATRRGFLGRALADFAGGTGPGVLDHHDRLFLRDGSSLVPKPASIDVSGQVSDVPYLRLMHGFGCSPEKPPKTHLL